MRDARPSPSPAGPPSSTTAPDSLPLRRPPRGEVQSPTSGRPSAGSVGRAAGVEGSEAVGLEASGACPMRGAGAGPRGGGFEKRGSGARGRPRPAGRPRRCGSICTLVGTLCQRRGPEAIGTRRAGPGARSGVTRITMGSGSPYPEPYPAPYPEPYPRTCAAGRRPWQGRALRKTFIKPRRNVCQEQGCFVSRLEVGAAGGARAGLERGALLLGLKTWAHGRAEAEKAKRCASSPMVGGRMRAAPACPSMRHRAFLLGCPKVPGVVYSVVTA